MALSSRSQTGRAAQERGCRTPRPSVHAPASLALETPTAAYPITRTEACRLLVSLASRGEPACPNWLAHCAERTRPHLRRLSPNTLAELLLSFAALEYHPGEDWLTDFDLAVVSHPHRFEPPVIADILKGLTALGTDKARFPEFVAVRLTTAAERRDTLPHITHPSNAHNNPTTSEPQHDELSTQLASGSGHISWTEKDAASPAAHTSGQASHSEDVCSQTHGSAQALDSRGTSVDSVASSGGSLEAWGYNHLSLTLRCLQRFGQQLADPTLEAVGMHMARQLQSMPAWERNQTIQQELSRGACV